MWSKNKSSVNSQILAPTNANTEILIPTSNRSEFSISLNYGAGTSTTAKLQASNDNVNFIDVPDSSQLLGIGGGSHMWNVSDWQPIFCKVVVTGDNINNEVLLAVYA